MRAKSVNKKVGGSLILCFVEPNISEGVFNKNACHVWSRYSYRTATASQRSGFKPDFFFVLYFDNCLKVEYIQLLLQRSFIYVIYYLQFKYETRNQCGTLVTNVAHSVTNSGTLVTSVITSLKLELIEVFLGSLISYKFSRH